MYGVFPQSNVGLLQSAAILMLVTNELKFIDFAVQAASVCPQLHHEEQHFICHFVCLLYY